MKISSFALILIYQGLVLGICSEILLFIVIEILPVRYKSHLKNIHNQFGKPDSKFFKTKDDAGFVSDDLKSVIEQAINDKIDPHIWWLEIKKENLKKD